MWNYIALVLIALLCYQPALASPSSTPESKRAAERSRPQGVQKNEKRDSTQDIPNTLSTSIDDLTSAIREYRTDTSDKYEQEKMERERESLKAEKKIADETEKLAIYTDNLASFTRLLLIVGVVQLGLFFWQLRELKKATIVAGKSADAASDTAASLVNTERAYVFVNVQDATIRPTPQQTTIKVLLVNYGKTPAIIRRISGTAEFRDSMPTAFEPTGAGNLWSAGLVLAPGPDPIVRIHAGPVGVMVTQSDINSISGRRTIYCMGKVEYEDVFGKIWETGFCWHYDPKSIRNPPFDFTRDSPINKRT